MRKKKFLPILIIFVGSIVVVFVLSQLSSGSSRRQNSFSRLLPPHPISFEKGLDLKSNSYYIAGITSTSIYLGNIKRPSWILILDKTMTDTLEQKVTIEKIKLPRSSHTRIAVDSPYFYLTNGTRKVLLRGEITNWIARSYLPDSTFFIESVPISSNSIAIKSVTYAKENVLGKIICDSPAVTIKPSILKKQIEGLFSTDGMLHFNKDISRLLYIYYYRNQFICMDSNLNVLYEGKTIDTISHAQVKVSTITSENKISLSAPPFVVNKSSSASGKFLFVNSTLLSKYENEKQFRKVSAIDVYNLDDKLYKYSFYIYDYDGKKVSSFKVFQKKLIAMHDHYIVTYKLSDNYFND